MSERKLELTEIGIGAKLTKDGRVVTVREVCKSGGRYGRGDYSNFWIPETIDGFKLEEEYGIWFPVAFEETRHHVIKNNSKTK
jgi:hypothetical protein